MKTILLKIFLYLFLYNTEISAGPVCKFFFDTLECFNFKTSDMENLNPSLINVTGEKLEFTDCQFDYIPVEFFTPFQGKLKKVSARKCGIKQILENNFIKVPELTSIDFSGNDITEIKPEMFSGLNEFKSLELIDNKIEKLDKSFFKILSQLQTITLARNKLTHLETDLFKDLVHVQFLDVSENPLPEELHLDFLSITNFWAKSCGLTKVHIDGKIKRLRVSKNKITEVKVTDNDNFETLDISNNTLMINICSNIKCENLKDLLVYGNTIDFEKMADEFKLMPNLEKLSLGNTNISILDKKLLEPLKKLKFLDLSRNNLTKLDFELMQNLEILVLVHTNISSLDKKLLEPLKKLKVLDISGNKLTEVDLDVFTQLNLDALELQNNPWKCSSLQPIINEYIKPNENRYTSLYFFRKVNLDCN